MENENASILCTIFVLVWSVCFEQNFVQVFENIKSELNGILVLQNGKTVRKSN